MKRKLMLVFIAIVVYCGWSLSSEALSFNNVMNDHYDQYEEILK